MGIDHHLILPPGGRNLGTWLYTPGHCYRPWTTRREGTQLMGAMVAHVYLEPWCAERLQRQGKAQCWFQLQWTFLYSHQRSREIQGWYRTIQTARWQGTNTAIPITSHPHINTPNIYLPLYYPTNSLIALNVMQEQKDYKTASCLHQGNVLYEVVLCKTWSVVW